MSDVIVLAPEDLIMNLFTLECFFSLVNYFSLIKRVIIIKFFHLIPPKLEYGLMVGP